MILDLHESIDRPMSPAPCVGLSRQTSPDHLEERDDERADDAHPGRAGAVLTYDIRSNDASADPSWLGRAHVEVVAEADEPDRDVRAEGPIGATRRDSSTSAIPILASSSAVQPVTGTAPSLAPGTRRRDHLLDLVRAANMERPPRRTSAPQRVRPSVQRIVDAMGGIPAFVRNGPLDILYANPLAAGLYSELFSDPMQPPNSARFTFLDPRARAFYVEWERAAHDVVAQLRGEAGRNPYDRALFDLVGQLSTRSGEFRVRWASHDVLAHGSGTSAFTIPWSAI